MALIKQEKTEKNTIRLKISVSAEAFEKAIGEVYLKNRAKITVPGFRKGKAPRAVIEKMYGKGFFYEDAMEATYGQAYEEALAEAGIEPVARPHIEITEVGDNGYSFTADVVVKPEVTLGEYKGLIQKKAAVRVTEKEIDGVLQRARERQGREVDVTDRAAENGDTLTIDYAGSIDGVAFDGGTAEKQPLRLGSGQFIPGFEDQLVGKNIGDDVDVHVTFPKEYHAPDLAGKEALFKVHIHAIKATELPELDDEFAKDASEFDTLDAYKADIKAKLSADKKKAAEAEWENALLDQAVANMTCDVPQEMIDAQADMMLQDYAYRVQSQGMDFNMYLQYTGNTVEKFRESMLPRAEKTVKTRLMLEAVAKAEGFTVSAEEIEAEYAKMAEKYGVEADKIKETVPASDLEMDTLYTKAVDLIKSTSKAK
ncbi:MAG: trigger factor [Clostridia bacterium]|nr:trigger factor [Clostridia bacterium]